MSTPKNLREFKRNPKSRGEIKKATTIIISRKHADFIAKNELNLSAIVRAKLDSIMAKTDKELKKNLENDL